MIQAGAYRILDIDVTHDYRETTAFDNELNYAVKSLIQ